MQQIAKTKFAPLLNGGDVLSTDESSILGRILGIVADTDSSQEELIFQMYSSFDPEQAEGVYLEKLVDLFAGLKRKQPTPAIAGLILRGSLGVTVPEGSNVSNTNEHIYCAVFLANKELCDEESNWKRPCDSCP